DQNTEYAYPVAGQPDGRLLVGGGGDPNSAGRLVRLLPDGTPDPSFGDHGSIVTDGLVTDVAVQSDGLIVAAEWGPIVRYRPDGSVDTSFGANGRADPGFRVWGIALAGGDEIVAAGYRNDDSCSACGDVRNGVARFHGDGTPD